LRLFCFFCFTGDGTACWASESELDELDDAESDELDELELEELDELDELESETDRFRSAITGVRGVLT
jgi:hypothetical protein